MRSHPTSALNPDGKIPAAAAKRLLTELAHRGFDCAHFLQELGLDPAELNRAQYLPATTYAVLYQSVMRRLGDEFFGIFDDAQLPLGAFSLMCHSIIHCRDLAHVIHRVRKFSAICRGVYTQPSIRPTDAGVLFCFEPHRTGAQSPPVRPPSSATSAATMLAMWLNLLRWLADTEFSPQALHLTHSEHDLDELFFDCPIHFNSDQNGLLFLPEDLLRPLRQTPETLHDFLRIAPAGLLYWLGDPSFSTRVRRYLLRQPSQRTQAQSVACALSISTATLRRRLSAEGTHFQHIKDEVLRDAAIDWLTKKEAPLALLAEHLGFHDLSVLNRAFVRWTGLRLGAYRRLIEKAHFSELR